MPSLNFKAQFAAKVASGKKRRTIRAGQRWSVGMTAHLFTGMRQKGCRRLRNPQIVTQVDAIIIRFLKSGKVLVRVNGEEFLYRQIEELSVADGFSKPWDFIHFFAPKRGDSFTGQIIHW